VIDAVYATPGNKNHTEQLYIKDTKEKSPIPNNAYIYIYNYFTTHHNMYQGTKYCSVKEVYFIDRL